MLLTDDASQSACREVGRTVQLNGSLWPGQRGTSLLYLCSLCGHDVDWVSLKQNDKNEQKGIEGRLVANHEECMKEESIEVAQRVEGINTIQLSVSVVLSGTSRSSRPLRQLHRCIDDVTAPHQPESLLES